MRLPFLKKSKAADLSLNSQARADKRRSLAVEQFEQRILFAIAPTLVAIQPNEGDVLLDGQVRNIAPRELTFRFDEGQIIDYATATTNSIQVVGSGGDGVFGNAGDVALGDIYKVLPGNRANEVIVRFADTLDDDLYQITIVGAGGSALKNTSGLAFNSGVNLTSRFELDLGAQITAVVPQPVSRNAQGNLVQDLNKIVVYFNNDRLNSGLAQNPSVYQLIDTKGTANTNDDTVTNPTSVAYDAAGNKATLTFSAIPAGTYRLRVGDNAAPSATVINKTPSQDALDYLDNATFLQTLGSSTIVVKGQGIYGADSPYTLAYPGGGQEPGHRDIPAESHLLGGGDGDPGIAVREYNFKRDYGSDPLGNPLVNAITEAQKQRAREIFELYGYYLGVKFVETEASGFTIATGDPRAVDAGVPPGGVGGIAGGNLAVMNSAVNWGNSEPLGGWFNTAMHEIGHLLGLGHTYDLPPVTVMGSDGNLGSSEAVFPGDHDIVHGQYLYRPDNKDVDLFKFQVETSGRFTAETIAERMADSSLLDSVITLYDAQGNILARNDDYFSNDSFIDIELTSGTYYIGVASTGNTNNNPKIANSGMGGTSEGPYELRLNFSATPSGVVLTDATGTKFDGDSDGRPGGAYNFWFQAGSTLFVDKAAANGGNGAIGTPFNNLQTALAAASAGQIVRVVGNGGADGNLATQGDNLAYEIGRNIFDQPLSDGADLNVPQGVTLMIDAGAILKLRAANVNVGSFQQGIDLSTGALQVLGTPDRSVVFTSYDNESVGKDTNTLVTTPAKGNWGGIVFRADSDYEAAGIFLNYVNHADITYGGGQVVVNSISQVYTPIHLEQSRPTLSYNTILASADAVISADPNSFEESLVRGDTYTADYRRMGPDLEGNKFSDGATTGLPENSINGLFVRIATNAGSPIDTLDVSARFHDTDIVYVLAESLMITGTPGGPIVEGGVRKARTHGRLAIDPGVIVKSLGARIEVGMNAQLIAEGNAGNSVIFTSLLDDSYGASGQFETAMGASSAIAQEGDWGGIYFRPTAQGSMDNVRLTYGGGETTIEGGFARFNAIEIHQANVRITNSVFELNDGGLTSYSRNGRGGNTSSTIYVIGAQPVLAGNTLRDNVGDAISIDANSMSYRQLPDVGRSTGAIGRFDRYDDNHGPLVRENRLTNNDINAMVVRGGTLTTQTVWDDTDIVHVLRDEIQVPNLHIYGGLRLQSSATESLVVKLQGAKAGFTAAGSPLDIDDRIGGTVQVIGMPGRPVVLTSIDDDRVGAGFDPDGRPNTVTGSSIFKPVSGPSKASIEFRMDAATASSVEFVEAMERAALYWESIIDDPVRIVIDLSFKALGPNILGQASSVETLLDYNDVRQHMIADAGVTESIVSQIPTYENLNVVFPTTGETVKTIPKILINRANALALGYSPSQLTTELSVYDNVTPIDATVEFSSEFPFDFNRDDGLTGVDFLAVAVHEIGHVLGFVSSEDGVDFGQTDIPMSPLDLFRVAPGQGVNFATAPRIMDPTQFNQVFYDGGIFRTTSLPVPGIGRGEIPLSTGRLNGDGNQASHWKHRELLGLSTSIGIMDPIEEDYGVVTYADRRAFDLIGWDVVNRSGSGQLNTGTAGDWRGLQFQAYSNDRNVEVVNELEASYTLNNDVNKTPNTAQFLGTLAANEQNGDDIRRLGFEVHGAVSFDRSGDVDVYSFNGTAGTEVWFDIDRTSVSLDTVVELVDGNGNVLARSNDSASQTPTGIGRVMQRGDFSNADFYGTNIKDAGMRLVLPGAVGSTNTYYVRVRSNSSNLNNLSGGQTSGEYQLQIRLREADEFPGSTVRFADIRNAVTAIDIQGLPGHSPLVGEAARVSVGNTTLDQAQDIGNLLASDRNVISVASALVSPLDADWYKFTIDYQAIQSIAGRSDAGKTWATVFDIDYADGLTRPDLTLSLYDSTGKLIFVARDSSIADDQPLPLGNASANDLSRGSFGKLDAYLGSVQLPEGTNKTYYLAITSNAQLPRALDQTFAPDAFNELVRLEPVNSVRRVVEDHIGASGYRTDAGGLVDSSTGAILPIGNPADVAANARPFTLADVALYVSTGNELWTVDPRGGNRRVKVGDMRDVTDIVMRSDGFLFGDRSLVEDDTAGQLVFIRTDNAGVITVGEDNIPDDGDNGTLSNRVDAITFRRLAHGDSPGGGVNEHYQLFLGVRASDAGPARSVLYYADPTTGEANDDGDDRVFFKRGEINAGTPGDIGVTTGMAFVGGTLYGVGSNGHFFTINTGNGKATVISNLGINFAGLSLGPQNVENGKYANTLFAVSTSGQLYALNTNGTLRNDVFAGGATSVSTGLGGATGLAFSPLDFNLWHPTTQKKDEAGHGINKAPDHSRDVTGPDYAGGASYYFGFENWKGGYIPYGAEAQFGILSSDTHQDLADPDRPGFVPADFAIGNNYNMPGGAHGSLVTNAFSLAGYDTTDKPTLYFNYFLETENANEVKENKMRDSARVFASADGGVTWTQLATNNSVQTTLVQDAELPFFPTANSNIGWFGPNQQVQELFDGPATGWRQARVDLGDFAGKPSIQLRFDFATAGAIGGGMQGDQFGNPTSTLQFTNNNFRGFYIDDIIVGFSERGEMVTGADVDTSFFQTPEFLAKQNQVLFPGMPSQVLVGPYQLEIRRGAEYANSALGTSARIQIGSTFDTNDRLAQSVTLFAPSGGQIADGQTFQVSDGVNRLTFEFDSNGSVIVGNVAVPFSGGQSAPQVAQSIRGAINSRWGANFNVSTSVISTSNRVELFGAAAVSEGSSAIIVDRNNLRGDRDALREQGQLIIQNNTISSASQYGIKVEPPAPDSWAHPGAPRNLIELNNARLAPGVVLQNNLIVGAGKAGIRFSGQASPAVPPVGAMPTSVVPFGRIINNTIYGAGLGIGIEVVNNASPTLLNNIVSALDVGISVDASSATTVVGAALYKENETNVQGTTLGSFSILLGDSDPLFVDALKGNFRLMGGSKAIDSSVNSLQDRPDVTVVTNPVGIGVSPILAPAYDASGQLRVDDPASAPPPGLGANVFKDRGALDRSDFTGPTAVLATPFDNDTAGVDLDPAPNKVFYSGGALPNIEIQLSDGSGTGIDDASVVPSRFTFKMDGVALVEGVDYILGYDTTNDLVRFTPTVGLWLSGHSYEIAIDNTSPFGVRDLSGNFLQPNEQATGKTIFTIGLREIDFGDAPLPYPTLLADNGARHILVPGLRLGATVTNDRDGKPSLAADADDGDDGVVFNGAIVPGKTASITVTASAAAKLDAWIDWNGDGDWADPGEQVFQSRSVISGANSLSFAVPATPLTAAIARFRLSTAGGLAPTGVAQDGEVEDYRVQIPPSVAYTMELVNPSNQQAYGKDASGIYVLPPNAAVQVNVYVNDLRDVGAAGGVFSGFTDLSYDVDSFNFVAGSIAYGDSYANAQSGVIDEPNQLVDEAGGLADITPLGAGEKRLLYSVRGVVKPDAILGGSFVLGLDPADLAAVHDTLVYGVDGAVAATYESVTIRVADKPWQNATNKYDVNNDGKVTSIDALVIINRINAGLGLPDPPAIAPPYYDVNGSGTLTSIDALQIINYLNSPPEAQAQMVAAFKASQVAAAALPAAAAALPMASAAPAWTPTEAIAAASLPAPFVADPMIASAAMTVATQSNAPVEKPRTLRSERLADELLAAAYLQAAAPKATFAEAPRLDATEIQSALAYNSALSHVFAVHGQTDESSLAEETTANRLFGKRKSLI
ncbi:MAG: NF038122 family metalloprotease [Pirellulales bacterium]|nr:NF038122 family metalloprotease [Pirellulales bacterium]